MPRIIPLLAAAFAGGVWSAHLLSFPPAFTYGLAAGLFLLALWQVWRGGRALPLTVAVLFFVAGVIRFGHAEMLPPHDISRFAGRTVALHGTVADLPEWAAVDHETVKVRYIIAAAAVEADRNVPEAVSGGVAVHIRQPRQAPIAAYGDTVTVRGRLQAVQGYNNPGQIDVAASYRLKGVTARMTTKAEDFRAAPAGDRSWPAAIAAWRQAMTAFIREAMAPGDAAILIGVIFGGYAGIKQEVVRAFAATGLVHILSVSGTHIALVAGAVLWLAARLGLRRAAAAALAAAAVVVYSLLAGLSPPVVRAMIMGLTALVAVIVDREKDALQALALAALAMLAWQPALLYDLSFQLSFGAAAGLVLFYRPTAARLTLLPTWLAGPLAATAAAQLGVLPFLAWYFGSFPLSSFVANLLVVPIIEVVVVAGLLAVLIAAALPLLGKVLLVACAMLIGLAVQLAAWLAALPGATLPIPAMGLAAGAAYYLAVLWAFGLIPRLPGPPAVLRRWPRRAAAVLAILILAFFINLYYPRPLAVHFLDVGQGDATLIVTPRGRAVLIDTGGSGEYAAFDIGERVVIPYLRHHGITALDYLILTHGHQDHAGGAAAVTAVLPVRTLLLPREDFTPAVAALVRAAGGHGAVPTYTGQRIELDGVAFTLLHTAGDSPPARGEATSSVVRVDYGRQSFLITGDLAAPGERALAARGLAPGSVLKVSHHGARTATSPELLAAYRPQYAVVSVGAANRYGHPHPDVLGRLAAAGTVVFRTDQHGAVVFRTDGSALTVTPYLDGKK